MGNLYRFVEPVVLLLLKKKGQSYGYDLSADLQEYALTDSEIERGVLYRTLRQLDLNGNLKSEWETDKAGPARRVYRLAGTRFEGDGPLRRRDERNAATKRYGEDQILRCPWLLTVGCHGIEYRHGTRIGRTG
jgi:hypothetical protein